MPLRRTDTGLFLEPIRPPLPPKEEGVDQPELALAPEPAAPPPPRRQYSPFDDAFRKHAGDLADDDEFIATVAAGTKAESGWRPDAVGDNGRSVGIFQMHEAGAGRGLSVSQRSDPDMASSIMVPKYAKFYQEGRAQGLQGSDLASYVSAMAERPYGYNDPNSQARRNYKAAYEEIKGGIIPDILRKVSTGGAEAVNRAMQGAHAITSAQDWLQQMLAESGAGKAIRSINEPVAGQFTKGLRMQALSGEMEQAARMGDRAAYDRARQELTSLNSLSPQQTYEQQPLPFVTGAIQEILNPLNWPLPGAMLRRGATEALPMGRLSGVEELLGKSANDPAIRRSLASGEDLLGLARGQFATPTEGLSPLQLLEQGIANQAASTLGDIKRGVAPFFDESYDNVAMSPLGATFSGPPPGKAFKLGDWVRSASLEEGRPLKVVDVTTNPSRIGVDVDGTVLFINKASLEAATPVKSFAERFIERVDASGFTDKELPLMRRALKEQGIDEAAAMKMEPEQVYDLLKAKVSGKAVPLEEAAAQSVGQDALAKLRAAGPEPTAPPVAAGEKYVLTPLDPNPLRVIDDADPSMVTVELPTGTQAQIGRKMVQPAPNTTAAVPPSAALPSGTVPPAVSSASPPAGAVPPVPPKRVRAPRGAAQPPVVPPTASVPPTGGSAGIPPPPPPRYPPPGAIGPPPAAPSVAGGKEYLVRPLANDTMKAGAMQDSAWKQLAQKPIIRNVMGVIDPAARVSGTATDATSRIERGYLLRARVLDAGESGVNGAMAHLEEVGVPFKIGKDLKISNLPDQPIFYKVLEKPDAYPLTPAQRTWVDTFNDINKDGLRLLKENDITVRELPLDADENYVPRLVEAIRGVEIDRAGSVGGRIGAKPGFMKPRYYDDIAEAVDKGVVFSDDPLAVLRYHLSSIYKAIADKRFADEINPLGKTISERVPQTLVANADAAKLKYDRANRLLQGVNRAYRGERLPPSMIAGIAKDFPAEAKILFKAGPDTPALQTIENQAKLLLQQARQDFHAAALPLKQARARARIAKFDESYIPQPFAGGRIFPKDVAKRVEAHLADQGNVWLRAMAAPGAISRTATTTIDFGAPFIQGLPILGTNPRAWVVATAHQYMAFARPEVRQAYYVKNADVLKEMAHYGLGVGGSEYLEANPILTRLVKKLPDRLAGVITGTAKQTTGRFQEAFGTFLDVSAVELWKAMRATAKAHGDDDLFALADFINHMRGTMSQRAIGVGANQQLIESTFAAFAPRYTKAGFALLADIAAMPPYMKGKAIQANLSALVGSAFAMYMAGSLGLMALGKMNQEEMIERLQPIRNGRFNSKFLTLPIGTDNVGVGGFAYSLLRLLAGATDKAFNKPEDLLKWDAQDNPLAGFVRNRILGAAPFSSLAIELATGQNYIGQKLTTGMDYATAVAKRLVPFWAEAYLMQEPRGDLASILPATHGGRVFPESYGARAKEIEQQEKEARGWQPDVAVSREQRDILEQELPEYKALREKAEAEQGKYAKDEVEQQTDNYFNDIALAKKVREREVAQVYQNFKDGKIDGKAFRDARSTANQQVVGAMQVAKEKYPKALTDRAAREAYYKDKRIEFTPGNPLDILAEQYHSIPFTLGEEELAFAEREKFLAGLDAEAQKYITKTYPRQRFEQDWMNEVEADFQAAMESLKPYFKMRDTIVAANPIYQSIYRRWKSASPKARLDLEDEQDWKNFEKEVRDQRLNWRRDHIGYDKLLTKYGYTKVPIEDQAGSNPFSKIGRFR